MATRPLVHRVEASRAITVIARRRSKVDDKHRELLPDAEDSDPREVLDYLQKYSGPDIPRWVLQADVCDALTLNNWLWWEDRRRELHFLKAGRERGLFLSQLGAQVGVGKQGVLDRIDRLEALLQFDRPDEKLSRAARQAARTALQRRAGENAWLEQHRHQLLDVTADLVRYADWYALSDEEREWINELDLDARDQHLVPATMALLGLAAAELRTAQSIVTLDSSRPHRVHTVLNQADALRSSFAALGSNDGATRATG
ncbi:hypothetical protein ACAG24_023615 [Mycobacterium sp. pW049]|uniref:hypothetical protein n=1 Tax=[Mycobacterium] bulgaricum TaxID=3238985 RepID=UPI00351BCF28